MAPVNHLLPNPDLALSFTDAAHGRIDLKRIERHWEDILRIIGSIHSGAVRAHDVIRMLSRDGRPTAPRWATRSPTTGASPRRCTFCGFADEPDYSFQLPEMPDGLRPLNPLP